MAEKPVEVARAMLVGYKSFGKKVYLPRPDVLYSPAALFNIQLESRPAKQVLLDPV